MDVTASDREIDLMVLPSAATGVPEIFDRRQAVRNRERAQAAPPESRFLIDWCARHILERLSFVLRRFPIALEIGALSTLEADWLKDAGVECLIRLDPASAPLRPQETSSVQAHADFLPLASASMDLVVSAMALHTIDDLPGTLAQIRRVLKPDGLFLAAMAGGETLRELRHCLMEAETTVLGGASPRILPFADKPQAGALLQRAGFALPVVDSEIVTVTYGSLFALMRDLRAMGETNIATARMKRFTPPAVFIEAERLYRQYYGEADGRLPASFEIVFLLGWSPHDSQQQPLRRGSAQHRLADALGASENRIFMDPGKPWQ